MAVAVSQQLARRRKELGLSLSAVARRAGTSSATLSRYEHGWTRFETYTLRKLATALGCTLRIELQPRTSGEPSRVDAATALERLKRLFWDHPLTEEDFKTHAGWILERVLEYGNLDDVRLLRDVMGWPAFVRAAAGTTRTSPRTQNFWRQIAAMEGLSCTTKYSRNTAWNC